MTCHPWSPYVVFESTIPKAICNAIIEAHDHLEYTKGEVTIGGKSILAEVSDRKVDLQGSELEWLNAMLIGYVRKANHMNFNYDLTEQDKERMQFSKYEEGMYFNTHMDFDVHRHQPAFTRKLSVTLQLSDPSTYRGGNLILYNCEQDKFQCPRHQGTLIVFDSRWLHEVTPIKKGKRYSMVKWVHGEKPLT